MKKFIAAFVAAAALLTFTACGNETPSAPEISSEQIPERIPEVEKTPDKDLKIFDVLPEIPETPQSELQFSEENGGIEITGYTGSGTGVRIPETIDGKKVTEINIWGDDGKLEEIILPKTAEKCYVTGFPVKYINVPCNDFTVMSKDELEKVYIEDSVTEIPKRAFNYAKKLKTIRMGSNVKIIGDTAFQDCELLSEIEIPDGAEYIGSSFMFTALSEVKLPNSLTAVSAYAFDSKVRVTYRGKTYSARDSEFINLFYKDNVLIYKNVAVDCFGDAENVSVPDGVVEIGDYAFSSQQKIAKITLPQSVKVIRDGAFNRCKSLNDINIPEGVEEIGVFAFSGCMSLKKLALPDSLKILDDRAFDNFGIPDGEELNDCEITYMGKTYNSLKDLAELNSLFDNTSNNTEVS